MAVIPFMQQQVSNAGAVPDLAQVRPNQAFDQLGRQADQAATVLEHYADADAALKGGLAFADFQVSREKRNLELRNKAQDPLKFGDEASADFDEQSQEFLGQHEDNPKVQMFLAERLAAARSDEQMANERWAAGAIVDRTTLQASEAVKKYANIVNTSPGKYAAARQDVEAMIGAMNLPVDVADKLKLHAKEQLSRSAVYGQVETNPFGVLKELQAGKWDDALDPDAKIAAVNAAQTEIKRREAEAKANLAQARAENFQDAADLATSDILSRQTTGKALTDPKAQATIRAGFTDKQWERYQSEVKQADTVFKLTGDLRTLSPTEMQATIDKGKPVPGASDFEDQQKAYTTALAVQKQVLAERAADPAHAVAQAFPAVANAWEAYANNPQGTGVLGVAIKRGLAAQAALGIPADKQKPLPAAFAAQIAGEIRAAPSDQAAAKLDAWQRTFGAQWGTVYRQLAPNLDPHTAVAATLSPNMAAILLETSRTQDKAGKPGGGLDDLRKSLGVPPSGTGSITQMIADDETFKDFAGAMMRRGRGPTVGVTWAQATEALAIGLKARNGLSTEEAAAAAIKATVGDKYNFGRINGVPFATPKAVDASDAEMGARAIQAKLDGDGLDLPGGAPGQLNSDLRAKYVSAVQRNGYWVTSAGNTGLELWAGDAPVTRYGKRVTATWEQLNARAPELTARGKIEANQERYKKIFGAH